MRQCLSLSLFRNDVSLGEDQAIVEEEAVRLRLTLRLGGGGCGGRRETVVLPQEMDQSESGEQQRLARCPRPLLLLLLPATAIMRELLV